MGCCSSSSSSSTKDPYAPYSAKQKDCDPRYIGYSPDPDKQQNLTLMPLNKREEEERAEIAKEMFQIINVSGSGNITLAEFNEWVRPPDYLPEAEKQKRRDMNAWLLFRLDKERNASITLQEMQDFFSKFTLDQTKKIRKMSVTPMIESRKSKSRNENMFEGRMSFNSVSHFRDLEHDKELNEVLLMEAKSLEQNQSTLNSQKSVENGTQSFKTLQFAMGGFDKSKI